MNAGLHAACAGLARAAVVPSEGCADLHVDAATPTLGRRSVEALRKFKTGATAARTR